MDQGANVRVLETEIHIAASPERVWSVLMDFDSYPDWNPFIRRARGRVEVGEKLEVVMLPPNGKGMVFRPTVKSVVNHSLFSWLGHLLFPGLFDGEHIFEVTGNEDGCRLVHKEKFSGLLVPLLWGRLDTDIRAGFNSMNNALKHRVEGETQ